MALLNPPDALPEAMRFLVRALLAFREPEADRDELVSLVAPRGLAEAMESVATGIADPSGSDLDDLRTGGSIIAGASLDALRTLGMVEQSGNRVRLAGVGVERWKDPPDVSPRSMFEAMLDAVIERADSDASHGVEDLMQALVLLHVAGEPLRPFDRFEAQATRREGRSFALRQEQVLGPDRNGWPVPNREQWMSFRRWASYLGLARPVGASGVIPDASEALAYRLPALAPGDYDVRDFVAQCASVVPVLDGGGLLFGKDPQYEGDHAVLTGGLTASLLQLAADGFVTLERRSDAGGRTLRLRPDGSADRVVTTVVWKTHIRRGGL